MKKLQNLPIGNPSFEIIRRNNQLYVDKTRYIFKMADEGMYYFMSRPRRFGKSLTVSTLRCLFQGKKELFKGLQIAENTDWEWKAHPVIMIDFNEISNDTSENLLKGLEYNLNDNAWAHHVILKKTLIKERFKELIMALHQKTGMPAVILIDEYDKPLINHLGKGVKALEIAKANRDILKYFFGVIKGGDVASVLRFVFITGVSKFSRVSIFSELNNLEDITMAGAYAGMLGYTREELDIYFTPYIQAMSVEAGVSETDLAQKLALYYDGYRFSKKDVRVYNPFSLLSAFKQKDIQNYWFATGTPTFLVNLLNENRWYLPEIEDIQTTEAIFSVYDLEYLKPEALLFQTGYITICDIDEGLYSFKYPNQEVKSAFLETLLYSCTQSPRDVSRFALLSKYLKSDDIEAFIETMRAVFASIPYTLESKRDEAYFHTVFYLMVCASGVNARSEVMHCKGRIDLLMEFTDKIYIIEFKCNQSAQAGIKQIHAKNYAVPYKQSGKLLILMGINFDTEKRNITEWKIDRAV